MSGAAATILLVTKPVVPPWQDGTRNLARALVEHAPEGLRLRVPVPRGSEPLPFEAAVCEPIYAEAGGHGTSSRNNLAMLARLMRPARAGAMCFLFAPTLRTGRLLRLLLAPRRLPTIHVVCSRPAELDALPRMLFARHHVALSRDTEERLRAAGAASVGRAAPGVPQPQADPARGRALLESRGLPAGAPYLLYAGDLEFSGGAETVLRSLPGALTRGRHHVVLACRAKTERAAARRHELEALAASLGIGERVCFAGSLPGFHDVLAGAGALLFPTANTFAKTDYPLVLLEALALGVPLVVAREPPVGELLDDPVGLGVASEDPAELGAALGDLLAGTCSLPGPDTLRAVYLRRYTDIEHARQTHALISSWLSQTGARPRSPE